MRDVLIKIIFVASAMYSCNAISADEIAPIDCMIEPNIFVDLSSSVPGVLGSLTVDKSDVVKKDQVIATLKSEIEQIAVKSSKQRLKLSRAEHDRSTELYASNVITRSEKDQSDNDIRLAELELSHAQTNLSLRQIKSPIDGVVVKRYYTPGEFVASKPIVKLAQLHPLRIEVVSSVENYGKIVKGMLAKIQPDFGDYTGLVAQVVVVDKVIDAASGTFGVRLELDNKDHAIPGGLKCKVSFMLDSIVTDDYTDIKPVTLIQPDDVVAKEAVVLGEAITQEKVVLTEVIVPEVMIPAEPLMCLTIGPYKKQKNLNELIATLETEIKQRNLRTIKVDKSTYLVSSGAIRTEAMVKDTLQALKSASVTDVAKFRRDGLYYVAAGVYSTKSRAEKRVKKLQAKGFDLVIKPRVSVTVSYWADLMYLEKHNPKYSNSVAEDKGKACDDSIRSSLLNIASK